MRELLYRGKCTETGQWVYGSFVMDGTELTAIEVGKKPLASWGFIRRYNAATGKVDMFEVERETVGQYTGLTDKNGKKIFEGDIVIGAWNTMIVIYFDKDYLQFRARRVSAYAQEHSIDYYNNGKMEVIGNIYDNHELLGGADNNDI